jgi:cephalosporin hydroxylase
MDFWMEEHRHGLLRVPHVEGIPICRWIASDFFLGLVEFIEWLPPDWTLVEVGSNSGESAVLFAARMKKVYCVDNWAGGIDLLEPLFDRRVRLYRNIEKIKAESGEAAKRFQPGQIDIVYIDADHSYEAVLRDIRLWEPLVKNGGYVTGHDFGVGVGVDQAVEEAFGKPDRVFSDASWAVQKHE